MKLEGSAYFFCMLYIHICMDVCFINVNMFTCSQCKNNKGIEFEHNEGIFLRDHIVNFQYYCCYCIYSCIIKIFSAKLHFMFDIRHHSQFLLVSCRYMSLSMLFYVLCRCRVTATTQFLLSIMAFYFQILK